MLIMQIHTGQVLELFDIQERQIGQMTLESWENELVQGSFIPGPAFPAVERLFRDFEEAANAQALAIVDRVEATIATLGLRLHGPGGEQIEVEDVQIWSDGGISCRISGPIAGALNGDVQAATPVERMRKS
jgi:hypothetical protein